MVQQITDQYRFRRLAYSNQLQNSSFIAISGASAYLYVCFVGYGAVILILEVKNLVITTVTHNEPIVINTSSNRKLEFQGSAT